MIGLTDPAGRSFSFGFDTAGRPISTVLSNGVNAAMSYDAADQLLSLAYANGGTTVTSAGYQYNATGTRSSEAREDGNTRTFGYDPVDRVLSSLNSALPVSRNETFSYDLGDNRTDQARMHDAADQLTQDANYTYTYDQEGNLSQKASIGNPADVSSYTYDAQNRLVRVQTPAASISYAYDALGRRIARSVNGIATRYVLDGSNVRLELDGSNVLNAANTHAGRDRLLVRDQGSTQLFFQTDALRSATALTDAAGAVVERYRYSAFGGLEVLNPDFTAKAGNIPNQRFTFTGREWKPETGLYFNRARFYDPNAGRFICRDPIGETGGINLYGYVLNNPVNLWDPFGLTDYNATQTRLILYRAYRDATEGPLKGLFNIKANSQNDFDFKGSGDRFCVNGVLMSDAAFGNYIAGFAGQAYDDTYGGNLALDTVLLYGIGYHIQQYENGETNFGDILDASGRPDILAGARAARSFPQSIR